MKKKILNVIIVLSMLLCLMGCEETTSYQEATGRIENDDFANGYFTVTAKWNDKYNNYIIMYANDTKVKYMMIYCGYRFGITPLYNADGTLQIFEENEGGKENG